MFYKTSIKSKMASISQEGTEVTQKVMDLFKKVYADAIGGARKTGQSIESITYEVLEGIEEGLISKDHQTEDILNEVAEEMVELIYKHAQENIRRSQIKKNLAEEHFYEAIEKEKAHLLASMETFQMYAKEKELPNFEKYLHVIEKKVAQKIEAIHHHFRS
ncbi:MAG: hypothetical protein DSZ03_08430 [Sulfurimonas sp.]|nr:MAG: hypothetical protein DSZ03_08430 [Sulfurimonas sp.]